MARKKPDTVTADVGQEAPPAATVAGYPVQDLGFNVWAVLADPAVCAEEIEAGKHDERLKMLEHVAKSQAITLVFGAAFRRRILLGG
jgi:hypothetical protein